MALRDLLLRYDYQDAVQLLMKLPSNLSVHYATQFALHLKDPIRFPKPTGSFVFQTFKSGTVHVSPHVLFVQDQLSLRATVVVTIANIIVI